MDGEIIYSGMTRPQLDDAYDNRGHAPTFAGCLDRWQSASDRLYETRHGLRDLRYGPRPRQRLDFFPAPVARRPTVLYIHGGYWQWIDKEQESFVARGPLTHGLNVALLEYTLSPEAGMGEIVAEVAQALNWLAPRLAHYGFAPTRSSPAAVLQARTSPQPCWTIPRICAALLISGVYDLEPIRLSWLNDLIGMDAQTARRHSPLHHPPSRQIPMRLAFGAGERPEFVRQSHAYHAALDARGQRDQLMPVPFTDHFSVMDELASPDGSLTGALIDLCNALQPMSGESQTRDALSRPTAASF